MGWHDVLDDIAYDWFAGDEDTRPPVSFGVRLERKLKRMPPADRIALARELLEGTGQIVSDEVNEEYLRWRNTP